MIFDFFPNITFLSRWCCLLACDSSKTNGPILGTVESHIYANMCHWTHDDPNDSTTLSSREYKIIFHNEGIRFNYSVPLKVVANRTVILPKYCSICFKNHVYNIRINLSFLVARILNSLIPLESVRIPHWIPTKICYDYCMGGTN